MMEPEQGFAAVNGTRLWYEIAGEGPPLVLVHGFALDHRMWDEQFAALAARHRVLRYDLRGFGSSATPDGPYRHEDDLAALLNHLGIASAAIVGLSLGGQVAVDFTLTYPEMVTALVPVDSVVSGHEWSPEWDAAVIPVWKAGRAGDLATAKARWLANELFAPARRNPAVSAHLERMIGDYSGWHWLHRDPVRGIEPPATKQLDRVRAPTLVIVGEQDVPDCLAIADRLGRAISDAQKIVLPGVGHMANMEAPAAFNATLLRFLAAP
jgi:pimeloyl-ACP methyl ester carboxylesterase